MASDQTLCLQSFVPGETEFLKTGSVVRCIIRIQVFFPSLPSPFPPPLPCGLNNNVEEWWKTRKCSVCLEIRF